MRWLAAKAPPRTTAGLQRLLNEFRPHHSEHRHHRASGHRAPDETCRATAKELSTGGRQGDFRTRSDKVTRTARSAST